MKFQHLLTFFFFFVFNIFYLSSQETKQVKRKNKNPYFLEQYSVLKNDKMVKHGPYKRLDFKKRKMMEGHYNNDKKDGIWSFYTYDGKLERKGRYQNDSLAGVWEVFNGLNSPKYIYNITTGRVDNYQWFPKEKKEQTIILNSDTVLVDVDSPVIPLTIQHVFDRVIYPTEARDAGISGTVIISTIINEKGEVINVILEQSVHPLLDSEVIRIAKQNSGKWYPAFYKGKAVTSKITTPYPFRLR